jgi:hypothetical protein
MFKQVLLAAVVATSLGTAVSPTVAAPPSVFIQVGPPPLRDEAIPRPRRGYDWTPGYWNWSPNRNRHDWVRGSWVRSRAGYVYAQPTWIDRGGRWEQQRGAWHRRDMMGREMGPNGMRNGADRDGDGVPNRVDRAPDNPRRN